MQGRKHVNPSAGQNRNKKYIWRGVDEEIDRVDDKEVWRYLDGNLNELPEPLEFGFQVGRNEVEIPEEDFFTEHHHVMDLVMESPVNSVSFNEAGESEVEMNGTSWYFSTPYVNENNGVTITLFEWEYGDQPTLVMFDGQEAKFSNDEYDGHSIEYGLAADYMITREMVPDKPIRIERMGSPREIAGALKRYEDQGLVSELESTGNTNVDDTEHAGSARGKDVPDDLKNLLRRYEHCRITDYAINENGSTAEMEHGGFKLAANFPETAGYESLEELVRSRLPEDWD